MTRRAQGAEYRFTGLRVADQDVQLDVRWIPSRRAALAAHGGVDAVDVFRDRHRVGTHQRQRGSVLADRLTDKLAMLVLERNARSQQVRAFRAAPTIRRM